MTTELITVEDRVAKLLEKYPAFRSSDRLLIACYYSTYHGVTTFKEFAFRKDVPQAESIRRVRQKLQKDGKFKANETTIRHREAMFDQYYAYSKMEAKE